MNIFYKESKSTKKNLWGGGGVVGARVSDFFY